MPKRHYPNPMVHRQYLSTNCSTYDRLYGRSVLHVDAWLYQSRDDTLYFVVLVQAGGQQELSRLCFRAEPGALYPVAMPDGLERDSVQRHVDGAWSRRFAPWLAALHWSHLYALIRQPAPGYSGFRSVVLHYVARPAGDDPFEGIDNLYAVTGRAGRDRGSRASVPMNLTTTRDQPAWSAAERSRLRTLDKLLK